MVHREFLADVNGSVAFASTQFQVNPGLPASFPWLAAVASRYESYRFNELRFLFETQTSTATAGTVILAPDYDATDAAPTTKQQATSYRSAVRSAAWAPSVLVCDREDLHKRESYYVRSGSVPANTDVKLYDTANLFVCTQGMSGATAVGELYVEYDVHLMTPQLGDVAAGNAVFGTFTGTANSAPAANSTGTLPATALSTGTTTSATTWTFTQPWKGTCGVSLVGTGLAGVAVSGSATNTELGDVFGAGAASEVAVYTISATVGQTFALTITNTTITSSTFIFAQGLN